MKILFKFFAENKHVYGKSCQAAAPPFFTVNKL